MNRIATGLVSVTFRALSPHKIVSLVTKAGLDGIEWGGDVHVPHGDLATARNVSRMTQEAGLRVLAYGSYYRCCNGELFEPVLETAVELGAPLIRIWAGQRGSEQADAAYRATVIEQSRRAVSLAAQHNITVAYEFHENTLTDTKDSAIALLRAASGMRTLWQPPHNLSETERLDSLRAVLPWLAHLHVFHWHTFDRTRLPLDEGANLWRERLRVAASHGTAALLEFVRGDDPDQFLRDALTLKRLVAELYLEGTSTSGSTTLDR